ncbi:MAG TPA: lysophospholipid acyltransferase family protein [Burkholderiales bacterium]|nr:lysophospholipid acyltransferase family protein [Burkholderiales bacterium]
MLLLMRLLAALPLPLLHAAGALLGWAAYAASPTYRRHLRENLAQAGYHDASTRRAAITAAGKGVIELPAIWLRPRADVLRWVKRIDGEALIEAARAKGLGIVFLTPHHGCFEITAKVAAERFPITALYRPPKLRFVQTLIESGRAGPNLRLATPDYAGVRELLGALKRGESVGVLPDQVPSEGEGEWVDFFGRPAYTMTLAGRLARRPGSVTLLAFGERLPRGAGYVVHLRPLPASLPGESDARRISRALEELVRECPQQYLWGYNRYKRPRGAPAPPGTGA